MRRYGVVVTVLVLALLGSGGIGLAQEEIKALFEHRDELKLSQEQVSKLEGMMRSWEKQRIAKEAEIRIAQLDLEELLSQPRVDLSKVKSALERITSKGAELKFEGIRTGVEARRVLTEEQQTMLDWIKAKRMPEREMREKMEQMKRQMQDLMGPEMCERMERMMKEAEERAARMETKMREWLKKHEEAMAEIRERIERLEKAAQ